MSIYAARASVMRCFAEGCSHRVRDLRPSDGREFMALGSSPEAAINNFERLVAGCKRNSGEMANCIIIDEQYQTEKVKDIRMFFDAFMSMLDLVRGWHE